MTTPSQNPKCNCVCHLDPMTFNGCGHCMPAQNKVPEAHYVHIQDREHEHVPVEVVMTTSGDTLDKPHRVVQYQCKVCGQNIPAPADSSEPPNTREYIYKVFTDLRIDLGRDKPADVYDLYASRLERLILEKQREALDSYTKDLKECVRDYVKQYPDADINDFLGLIVGVRNQPQRIESLKAQQEKK